VATYGKNIQYTFVGDKEGRENKVGDEGLRIQVGVRKRGGTLEVKLRGGGDRCGSRRGVSKESAGKTGGVRDWGKEKRRTTKRGRMSMELKVLYGKGWWTTNFARRAR